MDLIHNNSLHYLPIALAQSCAVPMLTTLHTPPTPWLEPAIALMDQARARFVAVSAHTAGQWEHVTSPRGVPNGVDTTVWTRDLAGRPRLGRRIVPEKAPHEAIRIAAASGRRIRLAGPIGHRGYFEDLVQPLLGEGAEYVGHLEVADLRS